MYKVRRLSDNKEYALKKVRDKIGKLLLLMAGELRETQRKREGQLAQWGEDPSIRAVSHTIEKQTFQHRHDNVIAYKEAFYETATSSLCLIMEYADGGDL